MPMKNYHQLEKIFAQIGSLESASGILQWDAATMLPEGSSSVRGEQLSALAEVVHEKITDPRISDWLDAAKSEPLNEWQKANLEEMRHTWIHANAVPQDLVSALTKAANETEMVWRTARRENDFALFAKHFSPMLKYIQEVAAAKSAALGTSPYDALLDQYDPGMRSAVIDPIFSDLESYLPSLVDRVIEHQKKKPAATELNGPFPIASQKALGLEFMERLGFDFSQGRLDISTHPFCGGAPGDVRITTRYKEDNFTESFFGVLHETGHALYEKNLPEAWRMQPVGRARGMSMHESQSLLVEMQLSLSPEFISFALPRMQYHLGGTGGAWSVENISRMMTKVERSLIRVTADEVTYPLHVILRYKLEKALLSGDLPVMDLPAAWNENMKKYLGITPPNDADGCLQDIHWAGGSIGYFPTYTLGAMIAAQLFDAAKKQSPHLLQSIKNGEFTGLTNWLATHVHSKASSLTTAGILQLATGKPLDTSVYKAHLETRYLQ